VKALLLAALLAGTPDAGTDAPFRMESAGTTLQQDVVCATPQDVQAYDVALRTAQADAAAGTQKAVATGLIAGGLALVLGVVIGGAVVAVVKK
jgi:hypothetical protein